MDDIDDILKLHQKLIVDNFRFLIDEYGLEYTGYDMMEGTHNFMSNTVNVHIGIGHQSPRIYIHRAGEPAFTSLPLDGILQYFGELNVLKIDFTRTPVGFNIQLISHVFQTYAPKLITEIDEWWLPSQKFQYEVVRAFFAERGQLDKFLASPNETYDYLKSKNFIE